MPQAIRYCDKCGRMIMPGAGGLAQALVTARFAVCAPCAAQFTPEQRARLADAPAATAAPAAALPRITPPPRRRSSGRMRAVATPLPSQGRPPTRIVRRPTERFESAAPATNRNAVLMAMGAGAVVAIAVLLGLVLRGSGKPEGAPPAGGGARAGPAKSEYALTIEIQEKLRKLMSEARVSTSAYEKTRPALLKFVDDHKGRQEADAAMEFVTAMDAEYEHITNKRIGR